MKKAIAPARSSETLLSYAGNASNSSIDRLLELAEYKLNQQPTKSTIRKKVFRILVETIQNAYHHLDSPYSEKEFTPVRFKLEKDSTNYKVITGNPVKNQKIGALKSAIDRFNSMSISELKQYYQSRLREGYESPSQGAGLGFVDIIRKSGKKISYTFKPVNKDYSYFSLQVEVST
jgi:sucrose-6-phosphate hydrolase SacC (GH32 family)